MTRSVVGAVLLVTLGSAGQAVAQEPGYRALELTPSAGYLFFGD